MATTGILKVGINTTGDENAREEVLKQGYDPRVPSQKRGDACSMRTLQALGPSGN